MPVQLALIILVPIFKGKGDIGTAVAIWKLLEHEMNLVKRVLEKGLVE